MSLSRSSLFNYFSEGRSETRWRRYLLPGPRRRAGPCVTRALKPALCGLVLVNFGVVLFLLGSGGFLVHSIFPRFDAPQAALGMRTLHLLSAPIVFASTAGLLRGALSVLGAFAPGFVAGSIISLCSIVSSCASPRVGDRCIDPGRGSGKFARHVVVCSRLVQLASVVRQESTPQAGKGWFVLWGAAGTILVGELMYLAVGLTERSLASWLPSGSIAGFFYASTLVSVPLALLVFRSRR